MIRTVTLNTGFDNTLRVGAADEGGVAPILEQSLHPSGKGINCARTIRALGVPVAAYGLVGDHDRARFQRMLKDEGIESVLAGVPFDTRVNITIRSPAGAGTHYRAPGFRLDGPAAVQALTAYLLDDVQAGDVVSLHGSTPIGVPETSWRTIAEAVVRRGAVVFADVYGPPLVSLLESRTVTVCKPNQEEALVIPGVTRASGSHAVAAVRAMRDVGVELPVVTLGADGLVFAAGSDLWRASVSVERVVTQVGAGDACMAGLIAAYTRGDREPEAMIRAALASAAAHVEDVDRHDLPARTAFLADRVRVTPV